MTLINFGSLNIDHVYQVDQFVQPGETISSKAYARYTGGKGLNQSIAAARAGAEIFHAGCVGADGQQLLNTLAAAGVKTEYIKTIDAPTGHAMIQVNSEGENCIIIVGGANQAIDDELITEVLQKLGPNDWLLLQNEISQLDKIIETAATRGTHIALNPAPMTTAIKDLPLEWIDLLFVNQIEGQQLSGQQQPEKILKVLSDRFVNASIVITLGSAGAMFFDAVNILHQEAEKVDPIDTTAAGDTFVGYFMAGVLANDNTDVVLKRACKAAALCVTRPGAADSIPTIDELS